MPIRRAVINSSDIPRPVQFYTELLELQVTGEVTAQLAVLDSISASIELRAAPQAAEPTTWIPDNLQQGFRHIGFKVTDIDDRAAQLKAAGVAFLFEPLQVGSVRVCFFYDPDGTLLEMVEGDLQYTEVYDEQALREERGLGQPPRPRFDHIAVTVDDREQCCELFTDSFGYTRLGVIDPPIDMDGFSITYLKSGPTMLEIFTFKRETISRPAQVGSRGFAFAELHGQTSAELAVVGINGSTTVFTDQAGFTFSCSPASSRRG